MSPAAPLLCEPCQKPVYDFCPSCDATRAEVAERGQGRKAELNQTEEESQPVLSGLLFKRYLRNEQREFGAVPGFSMLLYTPETQGLTIEHGPVEGEGWLRRLALGNAQDAYVCYVNTQQIQLPALSFSGVSSGESRYKYDVTIHFSLKVDDVVAFTRRHLGTSSFSVEQATALVHQRAEYEVLNQLSQSTTDRPQFQQMEVTLFQRLHFLLKENFGIELCSLSIGGKPFVDSELEALNHQRNLVTEQQVTLRHSLSEQSETSLHRQDLEHKEALKRESQQLVRDLAAIDADIVKGEKAHQARLRAEEQTQVHRVRELEDNIALEVARIKGEGKVDALKNENETQQQQHQQALERMALQHSHQQKAQAQQHEHGMESSEVEHNLSLLLKLQAFNQARKAQDDTPQTTPPENTAAHNAEATNTDVSAQPSGAMSPTATGKHLYHQYFSVDVSTQLGHDLTTETFGDRLWGLFADTAPVLVDLLANYELAWVRYEDNYLQNLGELLNAVSMFKALNACNCVKPFTERYLVLGSGRYDRAAASTIQCSPKGRRHLLQRLLSQQKGHSCVTQKSKVHDRELQLEFSNKARVSITLEYGMGLWDIQLNESDLPPKLKAAYQAACQIEYVEDALVTEIKTLPALPVTKREDYKGTRINIHVWLPQS